MANITSGNFMFFNKGLSPVPGFNFMLRVEVVFDLPCKSVRAFTRELEYELIQEGGLNDYVHMRRKPISKPFYLEVERYVGLDYIDPLPLGADLLLPVILMVSRTVNQFIPFVSARTYIFTGCTVVKKTFGDLTGDQSGLMVDTTTIAYREMVCVDAPWSELMPAFKPFESRADAKSAASREKDTEGKAKEAAETRAKQDAERRTKEYQELGEAATAEIAEDGTVVETGTGNETGTGTETGTGNETGTGEEDDEPQLLTTEALAEIAKKAAEAQAAEAAARAVSDYVTIEDLNEGALGEGTLGEGAPGEGALSEAAPGEGALGEGALGEAAPGEGASGDQ